MAVIPVNYERQVEEAFIVLISAEDYVSDNSIPVREWRNDEDAAENEIIVHVNSNNPTITDEQGRTVERMMQVDLLAYTHQEESDIPGSEVYSVYEFLQGFADQFTAAQLAAEITLTINGIHSAVSDEAYNDPFYSKAASFNIYVE
jgi:hypothetical protein